MKSKIIIPTLHVFRDENGKFVKNIYCKIKISNVYKNKDSTINGIKMISIFEGYESDE